MIFIGGEIMLSHELLKSLQQFEKILNIIEERIYESKEDILREIYIQLNCDYENIKKKFKTYNYASLMQQGYIYYSYVPTEEKGKSDYIVSMLANNLLLNQWKEIKERKRRGEFVKETTFGEVIDYNKEVENELTDQALSLYNKEILNSSFLCNGISYYLLPKEYLRVLIEGFTLPNRGENYVSILSKCKPFIEEICIYNIYINLCENAEEILHKTQQQLLVKSQFDIEYNYMAAIQEISKNLNSIEKPIFYFIIYLEENHKNNKLTIDELLKKYSVDGNVKFIQIAKFYRDEPCEVCGGKVQYILESRTYCKSLEELKLICLECGHDSTESCKCKKCTQFRQTEQDKKRNEKKSNLEKRLYTEPKSLNELTIIE